MDLVRVSTKMYILVRSVQVRVGPMLSLGVLVRHSDPGLWAFLRDSVSR